MSGTRMLAIGLLMIAATPSFAAEGRKEIFRDIVLTGSAASGRFFVSRDIVISDDAKAVIEVTGTGIEALEIDLNGFTLAHLSATATKPTVSITNVKSVTIRNGTMIGSSTSQDVLSILAGSDNQDRAVVEDLKIVNGDDGIYMDNVTNFVIQRNLVIAPDASGIELEDSDPTVVPLTGLIAHNVVREVFDGTGIRIRSTNDSVTIRHNHVVSASPLDPVGIKVDDADALIIEQNNVQGGGTGIDVQESEHCRIADNVVGDGNFSGLELDNTDECLVVGNVFAENGFYGIELKNDSDLNHIERNIISDNAKQGIRFRVGSDGNSYGRNSVRRNDPTATTVCQDGGVPSPCGNPAVCDETGLPTISPDRNRSFGDNMNDFGGC